MTGSTSVEGELATPLAVPRILRRATLDTKVAEAEVAKRINRFPYFARVTGPSEPRTEFGDKLLINLGSNNYLGLANDSRVKEAACEATSRWGAGVTGSRLLNGNLELHEQLEDELAAFFCRDGAAVFPTGYTANLGALSALLRPGDRCFVDADVHASLLDGLLLSKARFRRFEHNNADQLEKLLAECRHPEVACVVEGVYSMLGDTAPLKEVSQACRKHGALLIVDEAHSLGVVGQRGAGVAERDDLLNEVDLITVTFSKSLGSCGGAVVGSRDVIDALKLLARPFLFTASNTPASVAAALCSLRILAENPAIVSELHERVEYLAGALDAQGVVVRRGDGAIINVPGGSDFRTVHLWRLAWNRGVFCNPVVSPAVEKGRGVLRLSVMRTHRDEDLDDAAAIIAEAIERAGPPQESPGDWT